VRGVDGVADVARHGGVGVVPDLTLIQDVGARRSRGDRELPRRPEAGMNITPNGVPWSGCACTGTTVSTGAALRWASER
jgi:hypothetical protein